MTHLFCAILIFLLSSTVSLGQIPSVAQPKTPEKHYVYDSVSTIQYYIANFDRVNALVGQRICLLPFNPQHHQYNTISHRYPISTEPLSTMHPDFEKYIYSSDGTKANNIKTLQGRCFEILRVFDKLSDEQNASYGDSGTFMELLDDTTGDTVYYILSIKTSKLRNGPVSRLYSNIDLFISEGRYVKLADSLTGKIFRFDSYNQDSYDFRTGEGFTIMRDSYWKVDQVALTAIEGMVNEEIVLLMTSNDGMHQIAVKEGQNFSEARNVGLEAFEKQDN